MKKNKKQKRKFRWVWIPAIVLFLFLFVFYGPFDNFRLLWINTAMYSSNHKFLARMFFTEKYIDSVLARNEPSLDRRTDDSVLSNLWNDEIQFAEIKGNHYTGWIIKINDPRRLIFAQADGTQGNLLEQMTQRYNCLGGINASGYADAWQRGIVWGITIADRQIISRLTRGTTHVMGGFTQDYKLVVGSFTEEEISAQNYLWAFEFGPLLIVNGEKMEFTSYSGGLAPRTAIGQTAQGHVLLVVVDGRQKTSIGATFLDMQTILYANGAINAINLDGGSSTTMVFQGSVINSPSDGDAERLLPNAIIFR